MSFKPPARCAIFGHKYDDGEHMAVCQRTRLFSRKPCRCRLLKKVQLHSISFVNNPPPGNDTPFAISYGYSIDDKKRLAP